MKAASNLIAFLVLFAVAAPVEAQLFDNGGPDGVNGRRLTNGLTAQTFLLGVAANVSGFTFWGIETNNGWSGAIFWRILEDVAGSPGGVIASGLAAGVRSFWGTVLGFGTFEHSISMGNLALAPGAYWLALHDGPVDGSDHGYAWATSNGLGGTSLFDQLPLDGAWVSGDAELALRIDGSVSVPEPGALLLLSTGLLGLGVVARRRRRDDSRGTPG